MKPQPNSQPMCKAMYHQRHILLFLIYTSIVMSQPLALLVTTDLQPYISQDDGTPTFSRFSHQFASRSQWNKRATCLHPQLQCRTQPRSKMMFSFSVSSLLFLTVLQCITAQWRGAQFHVIREWRYINFTWPNDDSYMMAIKNQFYIPENNVIAGLRYYDGFYYLTLPRMKNGVPATLGRISAIDSMDTAPLLQPYPSWEMNREDDCNALQNVQNIEIDAKGQLWIIDGGHTSTLLERPTEKCPLNSSSSTSRRIEAPRCTHSQKT